VEYRAKKEESFLGCIKVLSSQRHGSPYNTLFLSSDIYLFRNADENFITGGKKIY
jgi:hypothetical protein